MNSPCDATGSSTTSHHLSPPRILTDSHGSSNLSSPTDVTLSSPSPSPSPGVGTGRGVSPQTVVPAKPPAPNLMSLHAYQYAKILGEGAFSTVILVRERTSGRMFAMKMCNKDEAVKKKIVERLKREKTILSKLRHPLIPELIASFTTREDAVFVLSVATRGDMVPFLRRLGSLDMECSRFYVSEIVLVLEYLHSKHILHRDLKPDNILLKHDYHILLTDYGTAKDLTETPPPTLSDHVGAGGDDEENGNGGDDSCNTRRSTRGERRSSFVGSPQYVSPEVLQNEPVTQACDYFALGSIVFQFLAGEAPFLDANEYLMFYKVLNLDYSFPSAFPSVAKSLVEQFLVLSYQDRLGSVERGGAETVKQHPFFEGVNFDTLLSQTPPRLRPFLPASSSCDMEFYSEMSQLSEPSSEVDNPADQIKVWYDRPIDVFKGLENMDYEEHTGGYLRSKVSTSSGVNKTNTPSQQLNNSNSEGKRSLLFKLSGVGFISEEEHRRLLEKQREGTPWDVFAKDRIIIKMGLLDKRVGYFARRRMFLFLQGPMFLYIDPKNKESKGEIKWCDSLTPELKSDKIFFIHVPGRVYYLIDPEGKARDWVKEIDRVKKEVSEAKKELFEIE